MIEVLNLTKRYGKFSAVDRISFFVPKGKVFVYQRAGAGNYLQFLAPGVIAMGVLFPAVFSGIEIIWDRQFGFLKETLVAPVSRLQIVFGRAHGSATTALIQGIIVLMICSVAGFHIENVFLLPVALGFMFLIALLGSSIGTAIGSILA
jgi:ABC-2 type transport system permease protein